MKVVVYFILFFGIPVLGKLLKNGTAQAVLGIVWLLVLIPYGIVKGTDYYRGNAGRSFLSRVFNVIVRVPLAVLGFMSLVFGAGIIGWVLYNVFVHREEDYTGPNWITGWGSFGVGAPLVLYGLATLRSVFRRREELRGPSAEFEGVTEVKSFSDTRDTSGASHASEAIGISGNGGRP